MIVVVEGPSAAGKSTWCHYHGGDAVVAERAPRGDQPDPADEAGLAVYWTNANSERWHQAVDMEKVRGLAVCDADPFKLHYSWCLARSGAGPVERFRAGAAAARDYFAAQRLGFADVVLVEIPSAGDLRRRKEGDLTRTRRNFALHERLADPLREWYSTLASVDDARRIRWELPADGLPADLPSPRRDRCSLDLFDAFLAALPTV